MNKKRDKNRYIVYRKKHRTHILYGSEPHVAVKYDSRNSMIKCIGQLVISIEFIILHFILTNSVLKIVNRIIPDFHKG